MNIREALENLTLHAQDCAAPHDLRQSVKAITEYLNPLQPMTPTQSPTNPHADGKAAHTEGSWHIGLAATERAVYGKYGEHIATLPDMLASDEVTANARLIAAAPELYEALAGLAWMALKFKDADNEAEINPWLSKAHSAIARATGQGEGQQ